MLGKLLIPISSHFGYMLGSGSHYPNWILIWELFNTQCGPMLDLSWYQSEPSINSFGNNQFFRVTGAQLGKKRHCDTANVGRSQRIMGYLRERKKDTKGIWLVIMDLKRENRGHCGSEDPKRILQ